MNMKKQSKFYITNMGDKIWYTTETPPIVKWPNDNTERYYPAGLHREDGPADEHRDGTKVWYNNGLCHRIDGPAVEYIDGTRLWYINGTELPTQDVEEWVEENNLTVPYSDEDAIAFKLRWV